MLQLTSWVFLLCSVVEASAQSTVAVTVEGIREVSGSVRVALFDNKRDFLEWPVYTGSTPVEGKAVVVYLHDVSVGKYGLSVFHDLNNNRELDTNGIGIPTEDFGFGNDAMGLFGPPSFDRASIEVNGDSVRVRLRLRHF